MEYEEPGIYTKAQIKHIVDSNDHEALSKMLVGVAFNEKDLAFAYGIICNYLNHDDEQITGLAIICLAHLARIHGHVPEVQTINFLRNIINSNRGKINIIKGRICDAIGDFSIYQPPIYDKLLAEFPEYFKSLGFKV